MEVPLQTHCRVVLANRWHSIARGVPLASYAPAPTRVFALLLVVVDNTVLVIATVTIYKALVLTFALHLIAISNAHGTQNDLEPVFISVPSSSAVGINNCQITLPTKPPSSPIKELQIIPKRHKAFLNFRTFNNSNLAHSKTLLVPSRAISQKVKASPSTPCTLAKETS